MNSKDTEITVEYFEDKFAALLENVDSIIETKTRKIVREEVKKELGPIKRDVKTIKAAVTATNQQVQDHEQRLIIVEQAA